MFSIEDYAAGKIAIVCKNDDECFAFFNICDDHGISHAKTFYSRDAAYRGGSYNNGMSYAILGEAAWCWPGYFQSKRKMTEVSIYDLEEHLAGLASDFNEDEFMEMISGD